MRNLKRALSLALAAAMLIGMMVVGASAASYKDEASIINTEAVDVLSGLGVIGGDQNGNYNPTATLTRAEFCVMMANALTGGKFDKTLFEGTVTPFTDINGHWGQAYIAYCYSAGVIAGTSTTTFSPDNTLTAAQASAILLSALGYNQNGEFAENGQFALNVTRWAQQAGLYEDLSVSANAGISRDKTAQLIFNALVNTTPVGYSSLAEAYYTVGTASINGVVYSGKDLDPDLDNTTVNGHANYYDKTLGFTNFGLEYGTASSDDFQRPAHQWISSNSSDIGTYGDDAVLVYTKDVKKADLEKALKGYSFTSDTKSYTDGDTSGVACADETALAALTSKGALVEIYANSKKEITNVVVVNTYLAQVDADYDDEDEEIDITVVDGNITLNNSTLSAEDFAIAGYEKDDYVLITVANGDVKSIVPAKVMEDATVTIVKEDSNITVGGTKYDYNKVATDNNAILLDSLSAVTPGDSYNVVLDNYGYVIGIEEYSATTSLSDYAFVKDVSDSGFEYIAKLVFTDGTSKTVTVSKTAAVGGSLKDVDGTIAIASMADGKLAKDSFVTYKVDKNGEYELKYVTTKSDGTAIDPDNGATPVTGVTNAGTNKTVFIAKDKAYTGVKNAPTVTSGTVYYTLDGKYLEAVYTATAGKATTDADEVIYILSATASEGKDSDDNTFYVYDAIVNGKKDTISTNNSSVSVGLYTIDSYTDGYADLAKVESSDKEYVLNTAAVAGTDLYKNGTLTVTGPKAYSVADDVAVYTIDSTDGNAVKTISVSNINSQNGKGFDDITLVLSSDKTDAEVIAIYMVK